MRFDDTDGSIWGYTFGRIFHGLCEALLGILCLCLLLAILPILLVIKTALMVWKR